jgi:tetratricopeptide (TPR) repeat protein
MARVRLAGGRTAALGAVLVAAAAAVSGAVVLRARAHRNHAAAVLATHPAQPAPAAPAVATQIKKIEALLEEGNTVAARLDLEEELARHPKDARIHYMLGRVAFAENRRGEALTAYGEAISLDAGFRGDPVLLAHVDAALAEPRHAQAALDLLVDKVGFPAADILAKVANEGTDLPRRKRAAQALQDMGEGDRVNRLALLLLELKKAPTCEERKPIVEELRQLGDPHALPALKGLRPTRGGGIGRLMSRLGGAPGTACMKKELADAIKELEEKS